MTTLLSPNFTLEEMTFSQIALRQGIPNEPDEAQVEDLTELCVTLLEPIRVMLGVPIRVDSGFRSPGVNAMVGGAINSAHLEGRAADIVPMNGVPLQNAFDAIRTSSLPFQKILFECRAWIHVQIPPVGTAPSREAYLASGGPGHWEYQPVARAA